MMVKNYPAYVFRMTCLLEKLGIKNAIYVHKDDVRGFCMRWDLKMNYYDAFRRSP